MSILDNRYVAKVIKTNNQKILICNGVTYLKQFRIKKRHLVEPTSKNKTGRLTKIINNEVPFLKMIEFNKIVLGI